MTNTVWILHYHDWEDSWVLGVFSSEAAVIKFLTDGNCFTPTGKLKRHYGYSEWVIDDAD